MTEERGEARRDGQSGRPQIPRALREGQVMSGGLVVAVEQRGSEWVATCDHGREVWYLHRSNKHLAQRSLRAHIKHEHLVQRDVCACFWMPESQWLSAASCGYGSGYEPGSQMEWNPDCPVHRPPHPATPTTEDQ